MLEADMAALDQTETVVVDRALASGQEGHLAGRAIGATHAKHLAHEAFSGRHIGRKGQQVANAQG
ncbi:hypothetical protein D3C81_1835310 [compost metagenome]